MITLDTVIQQLHIWDGQILLFIQEHLRMETLNPIVIAITNLGNTGIVWIVLSIVLLFPKKDQTCGTPFSAGIIGFPLRDKLPAEELCGTGPSL